MIICDNTICVRCLACVTESEFGGVTFEHGRIIVDESRPEDWQNIFATCPVGAIKIETRRRTSLDGNATDCTNCLSTF